MDTQNLPTQNPAFPQQPMGDPSQQQGFQPAQPVGDQSYQPMMPPGQTPYADPAGYVDPAMFPGGAQPVMPQVPQPVSGSGSPEIPGQLQSAEQGRPMEGRVEQAPQGTEQSVEQAGESREQAAQVPVEKAVTAPEKPPDQKVFESPYKLYGYKISPQTVQRGASSDTTNAKGDVDLAKTWLMVLLTRLLRMYKGKEAASTT